MNAFVRPAKHMFVPIGEIDLSQTIRPYNAAVVAELAQSIRAIGLQTPLTCIVRDGHHVLVSGRNRLEALRVVGCEQAPVRVVDFDDMDAELWRLSENLHRAELTKLEYDRQVVRYAELLKARQAGETIIPLPAHQQSQPEADKPRQVAAVSDGKEVSRQVDAKSGKPETCRPKVGANGAGLSEENKLRQLGAVSGGRGNSGGYREVFRELNIPEQTVRRAYQTSSLSPEAQEAAVQTGLDDNRAALLEAAKERTPEAQASAIRRIAERKISAEEPSENVAWPHQSAKPLRDLIGISGGELARWIKITTPNDRPHVVRVLRMAADLIADDRQ